MNDSRNRHRAKIKINSFITDNETVYFTRDNGAGFDMKFSNNLLGVFQRLHHASEFEGTGIDLPISQRIINAHRGKILAESEQGKGKTFTSHLVQEYIPRK